MSGQSKMLAVVFGAALLAVGGCRTVYTAHNLNGERIVARYSGKTLFAELPTGVRVPAVISAADDVARARGYTTLKKETTEEQGRVSASPPGRELQTVVVRAKQGEKGTEVYISYEPVPDRELCDSFFAAILKKLAL